MHFCYTNSLLFGEFYNIAYKTKYVVNRYNYYIFATKVAILKIPSAYFLSNGFTIERKLFKFFFRNWLEDKSGYLEHKFQETFLLFFLLFS